jgi:hypothetical protein
MRPNCSLVLRCRAAKERQRAESAAAEASERSTAELQAAQEVAAAAEQRANEATAEAAKAAGELRDYKARWILLCLQATLVSPETPPVACQAARQLHRLRCASSAMAQGCLPACQEDSTSERSLPPDNLVLVELGGAGAGSSTRAGRGICRPEGQEGRLQGRLKAG